MYLKIITAVFFLIISLGQAKADFTLPACYHNGEYLGVGSPFTPTDAKCEEMFGSIASNQHFTLKNSSNQFSSYFYHHASQSLSADASVWISKNTPENPHECKITYGNSYEPGL